MCIKLKYLGTKHRDHSLSTPKVSSYRSLGFILAW